MQTTNATATPDHDEMVGFDFEVTKIETRGGALWVHGKTDGHAFQALVWADHATDAEYEIGESKITKLFLREIATRRIAYNWDRGLDIAPQTQTATMIVELLAAGLADYAFHIAR